MLKHTLCLLVALANVPACGSGDPVPTEEVTCDDGIDNDVDMTLDCADTDCDFVVEAPGACVNAADLPAFRDMDLNVEWNACVAGQGTGTTDSCGVNATCITTCFAARNNVSPECATCFADLPGCVFSKCRTLCPNGGGSPACLSCIGTMCTPAYVACFGNLVCSYEYGCADQIDNDGDGLTDLEDPDCQ